MHGAAGYVITGLIGVALIVLVIIRQIGERTWTTRRLVVFPLIFVVAAILNGKTMGHDLASALGVTAFAVGLVLAAALGVAAGMVALAAAVAVARGPVAGRVVDGAAATVVYDALVRSLRYGVLSVFLVCLLVAAGGWLLGRVRKPSTVDAL